jgi:hypothetical protein
MMLRRREAFLFGAVVLVASSVAVMAQKNDKKQDEVQAREIQSIDKLVDEAAAGQAAPNDLGVAWAHEDYMKAAKNTFVPFTLTIDPSKLAGPGTLTLYWRVVSKTAAAAPPPPPAANQKKDDKKNAPPAKRDFPYEGISTVTVASPTTPLRVSRSFDVPGGAYDVYVIVKEPSPATAPKTPPVLKASVIKQSVTVPDFWNGELSTSSVIVTQRIDPLPAPLTPQQQAERPYAMGSMELVPVVDMKFSKKSELSTLAFVYNPKLDGMNKPDVVVEYSFCQIAAGSQPKAGEPCKSGEKFFNKTNPQNFNAQTLPPQWDAAAGHQVQTGQAVPLASFPEGEYRLEIKVTDKLANKSVTRDVNFSVAAS